MTDSRDHFPLFEYAERNRFNGADYQPARDNVRLTGQLLRIVNLMKDERWRTLAEIERVTGDPPASISAQLRHLRKQRFGANLVERRHRGDPGDGLYEYRVELSPSVWPEQPPRTNSGDHSSDDRPR